MKSVKVIIENPKGSTEKYAYDKEHGLFALKKILPAGMTFPYDIGFFPDTKEGTAIPVMCLSFVNLKVFRESFCKRSVEEAPKIEFPALSNMRLDSRLCSLLRHI